MTKTLLPQTFNVSGLDPSDASTYSDQPGGWQYVLLTHLHAWGGGVTANHIWL